MIPYEALDKYFEFSPIDEVAHAIIQLTRIEATNSYTTHRKIALTYGTIYRSSLIRRAGGKFLACLVPDMNPTA